MKSLFLGDIDEAVREVIKYFDKQIGKKSNDIYRKNKLDYEKLFVTKKYDTIFYFTSEIENFNNLSDFISLLDYSSDAKKYVYVIRSEKFNVNNDNSKLDIIKDMLNNYANKKGKNIIILNVSCLYGKNFIDGEIKNVKELSKYENEIANYINIDDFSHFLYLLSTHKIDERYIELRAPKSFMLNELVENNIKKEINENIELPFEWKPIHSINDEKYLSKLINTKEEKKKNQAIIKLLEVIVMFCIFELLNTVFGTTFKLQSIDFRLIFIVIVAIYYDLRYSLLATALTIISFLFVNMKDAYDVSILLNTDNWIAVAVYLITTVIIRSKIKRFENDNKIANDKAQKLEKQNKFKERNLKKYEIKVKELNKAIIMHDKSFSKIENVITKYKNINLESVYDIFSSTLDTKNIAIFEVSQDKFTSVYSDGKNDVNYLLEKAPQEFVTSNNIWFNNSLDKRLPLYMVPIYNKDLLCYFVSIWDYEISIVNHDYRNNLISLARITSLLKENEK